jgi:hypothetical protein
MCDFFSFVTEPEYHGGQRFYYNWQQRVEREHDGCDSHSIICRVNGLDEDKCNKFEYNFLTGEFQVDQINSNIDDRVQAEEWVRALDPKKIIEPLIVKPIINPFEIEAGEVTGRDIEDLISWRSVRASVRASVWESVRAYVSSFFYIEYEYDFTPAIRLWERGFVPSFDGTMWRLHAGKDAKVVYELKGK